MYHEYPLRLLTDRLYPFQQTVLIGMAAQPGQLHDLGADLNGLTEELHFLFPVDDDTSQGAYRLIAHKQDRGIGSPQIVL